MSSTVYVLGAGASKASSNSFQGIRNPVDTDFFAAAYSIDWTQADQDDWTIPLKDLAALQLYVKLFFKKELTNIADIARLSLEEVFSSIESFKSWVKHLGGGFDWIDQKEEYSANDASLLKVLLGNKDIIVAFLKKYPFWPEIQNGTSMLIFDAFFNMAERELKILIYNVFYLINKNAKCKLHDRFVSMVSENDLIISFNYDLIVDKTLIQTNKWFPETGYNFRMHSSSRYEINSTRDSLNIYLDWYCNEHFPQSKYRLLKLHGSLNWFKIEEKLPNSGKEHMYFIQPDLFHPNRNVESCRFKFISLFNPEEENYRIGKNSNAIVPPIVNKRKEFDPLSKFEIIWGSALKGLAEANNIIFIGYSLPPSDFHAKWLFRTGHALNSGKPTIKIVNPSESDAQRIRDIYSGADFENRIESFEAFVGLK
jgi:hypothetical protein